MYLAPIFFAITDEIIFISSECVTAIKISAVSTEASFNTSQLAPFPTNPIISEDERILSSIFGSSSISVISFPSIARSLQRSSPIFPAPTIVIFILYPY